MKFNPNYKDDIERAKIYFNKLIGGKDIFDMTKKRKGRSLSQNAYVHKLFDLYGIENGYDREESKKVVKEDLGYTYEKNGRIFLCKTSEMDSKELTIFIEKFRNWSSKQGCYLPSADEYNGRLEYYENEIERNEVHL